MDEYVLATRDAIKQKQACQLGGTLSSLRKENTADVILICGDKEFYAHKLILEANSNYFDTMFSSRLKEAQTGTVEFKDMEPDVLDAILDFIYTGEVKKIKSSDQVKQVLAASHMMNLELLVKFCVEALLASLAMDTFMDIWKHLKMFGDEESENTILGFLASNCVELASSSEMLYLSVEQLKSVLQFLKSSCSSLDSILSGLLKWILQDLKAREQFAKEIFSWFDARMLSQEAVQNLVADKALMDGSATVRDEMKTLFFEVVNNSQSGVTKIQLPVLKKKKLIFFSEFKMKAQYDRGPLTQRVECHCIQEFDLETMTWLPIQTLCFGELAGVAMCQFKQFVYIVGGSLKSSFARYDLARNSCEYFDSNAAVKKNSGLCVFSSKLFNIGGENSKGTSLSSVEWMSLPQHSKWWTAELRLNEPRTNPTLITSQTYIYVTGGSRISSVEYFNPISSRSTTLEIPGIPPNVKFQVTVANDKLYAVYQKGNDIVQITNKDSTNSWHTAIVKNAPSILTEITLFQGRQNVLVSVSTNSITPTYIWEPETEKFVSLPHPIKGTCMIPTHTKLKIYTDGI